jgi:hypothetical protein
MIVSTYIVSDQLMIAQEIEDKLEPVCLPTFAEGPLGVLVILWVLWKFTTFLAFISCLIEP